MKTLLRLFFSFGFLSGISLLQTNAQNTYYGYEASRTGNYNTHIGFRVATNASGGFYNTFMGHESGRYNKGSNNTFLGFYSGRNNDGTFNNFMGFESGKNNTGSYNIFLGAYSGNRTTGSYNTFMGHKSGHYNSSGEYNSFIGYQSGLNNTTGAFNTFVGKESGRNNTTASHNTFLGSNSGRDNTTAYHNTFLGSGSGSRNTTGAENTFVGALTGISNSTGANNTFVGSLSGLFNSTGGNNTFLGFGSGRSNSAGALNFFAGYKSGFSNSSGHGNTFLGGESGYQNIDGNFNTFLGYYSGYKNTTGDENIFLGRDSGRNNSTGNYNTYLGSYSGVNNNGSNNTFLGYSSGLGNTSGMRNVFIGFRAGYSETGSDKLYIDNASDNNPLIYGNFYYNTISIGTKYTGTTYKLVVPGRVRATEYWVAGTPDRQLARMSSSSKALSDVLVKVQKVESVLYLEEPATTTEDSLQSAKASEKKDPQGAYGFVSATVKEAFPELVMEEEGEVAINYQGMIPVLVEAIKELTLQKDSVIQALQQELSSMKQALQQHDIVPEGASSATGNLLEQNRPNPFSQSTTINYQVSPQAEQVSLLITNLQGMQVQRFDNLQLGNGQVELTGGSLAAGTYVYTLVVDGKPTASHKMILTK